MNVRDWLVRPVVFFGITVLLLALMGVCLFSSARLENFVWDETGHIAHGYDYLKTGNFWFDQVHAALPRLLAGLPLLAVDPSLPTDHDAYRSYEFFAFRQAFLFQNRVDAESMLMLARIPTMIVTILLGLVLALWTRRQFGPGAGLCALVLYTLDPGFLAHGHYATTDLLTTAFVFFATIAWAAFLESRRARLLLLTGLLVGVALAVKHSTVFLFWLFPLLYLLRNWQKPRRRPVVDLAICLAIVAVIGVAVVGVVYWPVTSQIFRWSPEMMADHVDQSSASGELFHGLASTLGLPYHPYLMGFYWLALANEQGIPAYLMGKTSLFGWWYFFPVAFAVKSTLAFLAGLALSLGAVAGWLWRRAPEIGPRRMPFAWFVCLVPPAVYFAGCLFSDINSGVRHLMPIYPFLFAFVGAVLAARTYNAALLRIRIPVIVVLAGLLVFESARAYPDYLPFFNTAAGGSDNGPQYLVDSSLDWGQDLKKLKRYMDANGVDEVCLSYFGAVDLDYYGVRHRPVPKTSETEARAACDCVVAVSATHLVGLYVEPGSYDWLRDREPDARVGHSIYVYDLRKSTPQE